MSAGEGCESPVIMKAVDLMLTWEHNAYFRVNTFFCIVDYRNMSPCVILQYPVLHGLQSQIRLLFWLHFLEDIFLSQAGFEYPVCPVCSSLCVEYFRRRLPSKFAYFRWRLPSNFASSGWPLSAWCISSTLAANIEKKRVGRKVWTPDLHSQKLVSYLFIGRGGGRGQY